MLQKRFHETWELLTVILNTVIHLPWLRGIYLGCRLDPAFNRKIPVLEQCTESPGSSTVKKLRPSAHEHNYTASSPVWLFLYSFSRTGEVYNSDLARSAPIAHPLLILVQILPSSYRPLGYLHSDAQDFNFVEHLLSSCTVSDLSGVYALWWYCAPDKSFSRVCSTVK